MHVRLNDLNISLVCYIDELMNAQRALGLVQQLSTTVTADSGSSIAIIPAKVYSSVFNLSTNFPGRLD